MLRKKQKSKIRYFQTTFFGAVLNRHYAYIYTDQNSYEPLTQIRDWTTEDGESRQQTHYFHCDQIGISRELTDKDGNLLWFGEYIAWKNHYKCKSYLT
ncbi:RHS domain-containing protein [Veillonella sp.]